MFTLDSLQGFWEHSHPDLGKFTVSGKNATLDQERGFMGQIVVKQGKFAMCGYVACSDTSTPTRVVWKRGASYVTWTRITEVDSEVPHPDAAGSADVPLEVKKSSTAPEPPKKRRLRRVADATINMQEETGTVDAKRRKLDDSASKGDEKGEADKIVVELSTEHKDVRVKSDVENANDDEPPQPKYSVLPDQYEKFYKMIAGEGELAPIPDVEETLQLELDELDEDAMDRVMGFLGYDPRDVFAELEFSTFETLKQHALQKVIQQEREAKPLFRWAAGRGPRDAPADVRCELEEEPDNMRKVHFLNVMAQRERNRVANNNATIDTLGDRVCNDATIDTLGGDIEGILDGQFSEEEGA